MDMDTYIFTVATVLSAVIGLCIGSFLNVVIYRVPLGMNIAKPASHCPKCNAPIRWYDNIPVLSYCILGGKCRHCRAPISFRYTAVELSNAVLWLCCALIFWKINPVYAVTAMITVSLLICVFFIDLEQMVILDRFQIMLLVAGVIATVFDPSPIAGGAFWWSHLIGAAAGFLVFLLVAVIGEKIFGREALGGGDVKLAGVMGLFLGWQKLLLAVLLSSVVASVLLLILRGRTRQTEPDAAADAPDGESAESADKHREYPFAPFLSAGFAIAILWGDAILSWYMSLLI